MGKCTKCTNSKLLADTLVSICTQHMYTADHSAEYTGMIQTVMHGFISYLLQPPRRIHCQNHIQAFQEES